MEISLSTEDLVILGSLKIDINSQELSLIDDLIAQITNWDYFLNTITNKGIGPLFFVKIGQFKNSSMIPIFVKKSLNQVYYKTLSRGIIMYNTVSEVIENFNKSGIDIIALKGFYLAEHLYHDVGLRQFSDIDLLVKLKDGEKCIELLKDLGYVAVRDKNVMSEFIDSVSVKMHYDPMVKDNVSIEIHTRLNNVEEAYELNVEELWDKSYETTISGRKIFCLDKYDMLIHVICHLDKHFKGGHIQFTGFADIVNILPQIDNWEYLTARCQAFDCELTVMKYIVMVNKYFQSSVPFYIVDKYKFSLSKNDELSLIDYLHNENTTKKQSKMSFHLWNILHLKSIYVILKYIHNILIPSKAFMLRKYDIKRPRLFWAWYPYRWWVGLKGLVKLIMKN